MLTDLRHIHHAQSVFTAPYRSPLLVFTICIHSLFRPPNLAAQKQIYRSVNPCCLLFPSQHPTHHSRLLIPPSFCVRLISFDATIPPLKNHPRERGHNRTSSSDRTDAAISDLYVMGISPGTMIWDEVLEGCTATHLHDLSFQRE